MKYRAPITFGLFVLFVGVFVSGAFDLYHRIPHIDKVYHALGGVALGWFFFVFFFNEGTSLSKFKQTLIVVSATCLVAVLWEYVERLSTLYAPVYAPWFYHWIKGGDLNDTLLDILAGMCGSLVFVCARFLKGK